jgi:hypothetical protein
MTFETADDVLGHFGVKGMHWGVVKNKSRSGVKRTGKQKAAIAGVGVAAYLAGSTVAGSITKSGLLSLAGGGAAAAFGVRAARNIIDEHGDTKVKDIGR